MLLETCLPPSGPPQQVDGDKRSLYYVLLEIPLKVVKHLQQTAQAGYDRMRQQVDTDTNDAPGGDDQAIDATHVSLGVCFCRPPRSCLHVCTSLSAAGWLHWPTFFVQLWHVLDGGGGGEARFCVSGW
jgi:hypothetical protein